jgi:hypothetical protein
MDTEASLAEQLFYLFDSPFKAEVDATAESIFTVNGQHDPSSHLVLANGIKV